MFIDYIIVAVVAAILYWFNYPIFQDVGKCPEGHFPPLKSLSIENIPEMLNSIEGECFFSENYDEATKQFAKLAQLAGGKISKMSIDDDLNTYVSVFEGSPDKFLVHISGTHGVEAYAGSAIQASILEYLRFSNIYSSETPEKNNLPTVIMIHALNPYGFKNNRRTNEDNIDLNRNFLTSDEFVFVKNRDPNLSYYLDLDHILNPTKKPTNSIFWNELLGFGDVLRAVFHHGTATIKRAMVSGNYHKQTGYGFGGFEYAKSTRNLMNLLIDELKIPQLAKKFVLIDVHTGLGPSGIDTLMYLTHNTTNETLINEVFPYDYDPSGLITGALKAPSPRQAMPNKISISLGGQASEYSRIKSAEEEEFNKNNDIKTQHIPKRSVEDAYSVSEGYDMTLGTIAEGFCEQLLAPGLSDENRVCVTQEFGTVPMIQVGKYAIDENYAHFWGNENEKNYYKKQLKGCFYVETKEWKRKIIYRGLKLFLQVI